MSKPLDIVLPFHSQDVAAKSTLKLVGIAAASALLWYILVLVYRVYFHPLAKYPGPKHLAATDIPWVYKEAVSGTTAREAVDLHKKYGPIVRIGPNRLAVDGAVGFPQIFQHRPGQPEWPKKRGFFGEQDELRLIGSAHEEHRRRRRQLGYAFSDASMKEQETFMKPYIDKLCQRFGEKAASGETFDLVKWFNFTTFDIIGDLMFSDSFHSLAGGDYHPWVLSIIEGIRGTAMIRAIDTFPLIGPFVRFFGSAASDIAANTETRTLASEKALLRKAQGEAPGGRKDFMTYMLKTDRDGHPGFTETEIIMNSADLVIAGSETTATSLSAMFWHLGLPKYRPIYDRLCDEIRSAFQSEDELDMKSVARLPYLQAVIEENLRMYPPAAELPPRISPGAKLNGEFIPKGTAVTTYQLATFHNPANFADPDTFRPERWLPASHPLYDPMFANDNRAACKPFSFGTRDCLGKNLAYSELRLVIARILYRFDFELAPGQEDWASEQPLFLVWVKPPLNILFKERQLQSKLQSKLE
ncbi:cytochrome P450 [Cryphonectria parasitica EP155]|uniref:Cytochrome P450 n=1 Tax=Cryphonectria parasitica (strain ATCC 38755 / EP155) TaxID=660469 RepID=A0A9P4Y997_CRYP1|nr:cytochrome P450 [Cryphonectria parasitica EP155]KAF3769327.1 cytochrome P450 [Cryphonectria parasitica EP155]